MPDPSMFLSTVVVAKRLGCTRATVMRMCQDGRLPTATFEPGYDNNNCGRWRIPVQDLRTFQDRQNATMQRRLMKEK